MTDYPKPATPLPWRASGCLSDCDVPYLIHAANAFPHLVAALEEIAGVCSDHPTVLARRALAIARGEMKP